MSTRLHGVTSQKTTPQGYCCDNLISNTRFVVFRAVKIDIEVLGL
jgi:hypothetical protein